MKKQHFKSLTLNKKSISHLSFLKGGRAPGNDTISDPVGITDDCPPSIPHTDCNCGSDFNKGCGSIIGHC